MTNFSSTDLTYDQWVEWLKLNYPDGNKEIKFTGMLEEYGNYGRVLNAYVNNGQVSEFHQKNVFRPMHRETW